MGPSVYTVPPGVPFLGSLAAGILKRHGGGALALTRVTVLLPTRRACLAARDAFLRRGGGKALLLPRLTPIGDIDPDAVDIEADPTLAGDAALSIPPAVGGLKRQLLLTRLVLRWHGGETERAVALARELGRLLDEVQSERLSFDALAGLVPADYAEHWQQTLSFLDIVTRHWPDVLAERSVIDPAARRNHLIEAVTERWRTNPPADPVVAAGSTGSVPATADLLAVVAELPKGRIILPGLDRELDEESWDCLDETHPQYGLKLLLGCLGVARSEVAEWEPGEVRSSARERAELISLALRPSPTTSDWAGRPPPPDAAWENFERVDCPSPQEEAGVIALKMRQALTRRGRTAALVTRDRGLARRVSAELGRWGITVDDSAGQPLANTVPGSFLRLTASLVSNAVTPIALLAVLKHPLAAAGASPGAFRTRARGLERLVLRGLRPAPGFDGVDAALADITDFGAADERDAARELRPWFARLSQAGRDFAGRSESGSEEIESLVRAHLTFSEWLASSDVKDGATRLWTGEAGESAAAFFVEFLEAAPALPSIAGSAYVGLLEGLLSESVARPKYGSHPRLHIWGPLEARLQHADLMILGGLNEGSWPPEPPADPWLSRPMRTTFGLPSPERRIGLAAHDFAAAAAAEEVMLTRSEKVDGAPTVPARWLTRLEALIDGWSLTPFIDTASDWLAWQRRLDTPAAPVTIDPPSPRPPPALRPRRLSVTEIETWMRDPYAIYARHVLKLRPLDPIDAEPGPAERGGFIHDAVDRFVRAFPGDLPENARERLLDIGREVFAPMLDRGRVATFWWPSFERLAAWLCDHERERRREIRSLFSEVRGRTRITAPGGDFTLVAKADRIELGREGNLAVIDYKTGSVPSQREIRDGFSPQLALEALIAENGGFDGIAAATVTEMAFWRLSGGEPAGAVTKIKEVSRRIEEAREGLAELVRRFDDPETPYHSQPHPHAIPRFSDYVHLARVQEWSTDVGNEE